MKLKELKNISLLKEGRVDPNVLLSISNIIKNNKVTDSFQYLMLYRIIEMIKFGKFYNEPNFYRTPATNPLVNIPTQVEILNTLRSMTQPDLVLLSTKFYEMLISKNLDELSSYCNVNQGLMDWINFVNSKEAID